MIEWALPTRAVFGIVALSIWFERHNRRTTRRSGPDFSASDFGGPHAGGGHGGFDGGSSGFCGGGDH
jgi:hypothetical protein